MVSYLTGSIVPLQTTHQKYHMKNPGSEASGLTRSSRDDRHNTDWEDLASFRDGDKHWLVVADIADNVDPG